MNQLIGHLREKGQAIAAEVLGDISQTNVHTDQPENNNNKQKSEKLLQAHLRDQCIRYGNPRGIRMVFVVRNLVQLVYVLVPHISHLGNSQNLLVT